MTALAAAKDVPRISPGGPIKQENFLLDVAASTTLYPGSLIAVNADGYAVPISAAQGLRAVGICDESAAVDNSAGANGDETVRVRRGIFKFANSATTDALTIADLMEFCYAADDQTVARTDSNGTRMQAGIVVQVATDGVWVEVGSVPNPNEAHLVAAEDLTAAQFHFVHVDSSGTLALTDSAGAKALGVLQNAPDTGEVGVVRYLGKTRVIAGATVGEEEAIKVGADAKADPAVVSTADASASSATAEITGSYVMGLALTPGTDGSAMSMVLTHAGAIAGAAA